MGRFRSTGKDDETCGLSKGRRDTWCEGGRDDVEACSSGDGELDRDRDCAMRVFNRFVLRSCSNWWVNSVALKALCG